MEEKVLENKNFDSMELSELIKAKEVLALQSINIKGNIDKLLENEMVRQFIEEYMQKKQLDEDIKKLDLKIKRKTMLCCKHVWVKTCVEKYYDDKDEYYTCVKCGLDTFLFKDFQRNPESAMMHEVFFINNGGRYVDRYIPKNDALDLYKKIKEMVPDITDDELVDQFAILNQNRLRKPQK